MSSCLRSKCGLQNFSTGPIVHLQHNLAILRVKLTHWPGSSVAIIYHLMYRIILYNTFGPATQAEKCIMNIIHTKSIMFY